MPASVPPLPRTRLPKSDTNRPEEKRPAPPGAGRRPARSFLLRRATRRPNKSAKPPAKMGHNLGDQKIALCGRALGQALEKRHLLIQGEAITRQALEQPDHL